MLNRNVMQIWVSTMELSKISVVSQWNNIPNRKIENSLMILGSFRLMVNWVSNAGKSKMSKEKPESHTAKLSIFSEIWHSWYYHGNSLIQRIFDLPSRSQSDDLTVINRFMILGWYYFGSQISLQRALQVCYGL